MKKKSWIIEQRKDVSKVYAPEMKYSKEFDILHIRWLPQLNYAFSLETENGFVFDISPKPNEEVVGIEIFDFMKKIKQKRGRKK